MPRCILAEFNTHRMFSRNSASSRAIPVEKMLKRVQENPFTPIYWGKNQKGMQAKEELDLNLQPEAIAIWLEARDDAVRAAKKLLVLGVHKQIANRLLEPFLWHTVIVTSTDWSNFFNLRNNPDAQPEIEAVAQGMQGLIALNEPQHLTFGQWHLPLILEEDRVSSTLDDIIKASAARCARVSYVLHDTGKRDINADLVLADRLINSGHLSPCEHQATPGEERYYGNFYGWKSFRKMIPGEEDILGYRKNENISNL